MATQEDQDNGRADVWAAEAGGVGKSFTELVIVTKRSLMHTSARNYFLSEEPEETQH